MIKIIVNLSLIYDGYKDSKSPKYEVYEDLSLSVNDFSPDAYEVW